MTATFCFVFYGTVALFATIIAGEFVAVPLPYAKNALEPHIGEQTMNFHYDKHYAGYLAKVNTAINELQASDPLKSLTLEQLMQESSLPTNLRNNGGGAYNHGLFWTIMGPKGTMSYDKTQHPKFEQQVAKDFSDKNGMLKELVDQAKGVFGSGWSWVVYDESENKLKVVTTANQDNPMMSGVGIPILGIDVWEHAYYLDYQNLRGDYLSGLTENVLNMTAVAMYFTQYALQGNPPIPGSLTPPAPTSLPESSSPGGAGDANL